MFTGKKISEILFFLCIAFLAAGFINVPASAEQSGNCGKEAEWKYDGSGALTVSGKGVTQNYGENDKAPWNGFASEIREVIFEEGVTAVGNYMFADCVNLENVKFPNSIEKIGIRAFKNCIALKTVLIPESVTELGAGAFDGCVLLNDITISVNVASIGKNAFKNTAFINNESKYENGILYVGNHLIKALDAKLPQDITIKEGTLSIAEKAFEGCSSLVSASVPKSVVSIENEAFKDCVSLKTIYLTDNVSSIGADVFKGCPSLTVDCPILSFAEEYALKNKINVDHITIDYIIIIISLAIVAASVVIIIFRILKARKNKKA